MTLRLFWVSYQVSNHAVIVAAGKGQRFGGTKQFFPVRRHPLLFYAVDNFEKNKRIKNIIVVVPKNRIKYTKKLMKKWKLRKVHNVISGGKRRQDSVLNALKSIKSQSGIVIIHDGVRPIVTQNLINKGIRLCCKRKAVVFGSEINDTIKEAKSHLVIKTLPRNRLYLIQTPQFFDLNLLKSAFKEADFSYEYTDEAALLESLKIPVYLYQGDRMNLKITKRQDIKILERFLK